jgi:hypothetical protein
MAVPVDPVEVCQSIELALSMCEDQLAVARSMSKPIGSTTNSPEGMLPYLDPVVNEVTSAVIASGLLLGAFVMLHIIRQAWYLWGGEGAFAFPFDK